jgi:hypothetical protein
MIAMSSSIKMPTNPNKSTLIGSLPTKQRPEISANKKPALLQKNVQPVPSSKEISSPKRIEEEMKVQEAQLVKKKGQVK